MTAENHSFSRMKAFMLLSVYTLLPVGLFAQHVTEEQALQKAQAFIQGITKKNVDSHKHAPAKVPMMHKVAPAVESDAFYLFNIEDGGGFVIVSGDERTDDILGYGTEGSIDPEQMPENMRGWLVDCETLIKGIQAGVKAAPAKVPIHPAVPPMITAKWDQSKPYNLKCPKEGSKRCLTGCTATSLAQIMYYHRWPQEATAEIPAYDYGDGKHCDALPPVVFDWDNMADKYSENATGASADAVATLMRYCGQALQMNYSPTASSADMTGNHLADYFGYDSRARARYSPNYSMAEWDAIIYHEMECARPVWYSGAQSLQNAHAFVLDGYDGQGFYHVNWGWSGNYNGYFKITHLAPNGTGNGGGVAGVGYDLLQTAVVGIQPPSSTPETPLYDVRSSVSLFGSADFLFENETSNDVIIDMGARIVGRDGTDYDETIILASDITLSSGSDRSFSLYLDSLANGHYRLNSIWRYSGETEWKQGTRHVCISKEDDDCSKLFNMKADIEISGSQLVNDIQDIVVTVSNLGCELKQQQLRLYVSKTSKKEYVNRVLLSLEDDATETFTFKIQPSSTGTYHIWLTTDNDGNNVVGQTDIEIVESARLSIIGTWYSLDSHEMNITINNNADIDYSRNCLLKLWPGGKDEQSATVVDCGKLQLSPNESTTLTLPLRELSLDSMYYCTVSYYINQEKDILRNSNASDISFSTETGFSYLDYYMGIADKTKCIGNINSVFSNDEAIVVPHRAKYNKNWYAIKQFDAYQLGEYDLPKCKSFELEEGIVCLSTRFYELDSLKTITLPSTLRFFSEYLISNCMNLEAIYCKGAEPPLVVNADGAGSIIIEAYDASFNDVSDAYYQAVTLYVPTGCAEAYRNAPGWKRFTNIVESDMKASYYLWTAGIERGGKATATDSVSVGYANSDYTTIRLNGKADFSTDYVTIKLDKPLSKGDIISITGYRNKSSANKQSGVKIMTQYLETVLASSTGLEFVNIDQSEGSADDSNRGTEPNTCVFTVPDEAAGSRFIKLTRSHTQTNFFITKIAILMRGDVNADGVVNIADVAAVLNIMAGNSTGDGDVNGDGVVNIADVAAVLNIMAGNGQ